MSRLDLIVSEEEKRLLEEYCRKTKRTKTDVLRELIRSLNPNTKPS
jgi:hypothetical protein